MFVARRLIGDEVADGVLTRALGFADRSLPLMYQPERHGFVQTVRGVAGPDGPRLRPEGTSVRYAAICALGLARAGAGRVGTALGGDSLEALLSATVGEAATASDPGAVALAAWAMAEAGGRPEAALFDRLRSALQQGPMETVTLSWVLCAALAARDAGASGGVIDGLIGEAARRLLDGQSRAGIFPHVLPAGSASRWRAHVSCFADAVYPIQALARLAAADGDQRALDAAERCAAAMVGAQGPAGQWWWHYDVRTGGVVEGYPVYSVHQHAMGPMALRELAEAGGTVHADACSMGLRWLVTHPECFHDLVDDHHGLVWRRVARREPAKAARRLAAVTSAVRPGLRLPGLGRVLVPGEIDLECRPYEFGWLLYAWN